MITLIFLTAFYIVKKKQGIKKKYFANNMSRSLMRPECSLLKKECPKLKLSKLLGDSRLLYLVQNRPAAENTLSESVDVAEIVSKSIFS